jgi:GNAT superfamily N-acetyltransferase
MVVKIETDEQILSTFAVMAQLRPHLAKDEYVPRVRRMIETNGFYLAAVVEDGVVRAVAGYRYLDLLWCGKVLYVDDLSTDERQRSQGHGKTLIDWLRAEAKANGCVQLHLDSGVQRDLAHRFYFREGLTIVGYHFRSLL